VAEVLMLVVPTLLVAAAVVVVVLAYTGAEVALFEELVDCFPDCI
jgi:hypothetical protein